jgi:tetratricopeptide (TPR) repeat protein
MPVPLAGPLVRLLRNPLRAARKATLLLLLPIVFPISGCPPVETVNSLYSGKAKAENPGIVGKWNGYFVLDSSLAPFLPISLEISVPNDDHSPYTVSVSRIGGATEYDGRVLTLGGEQFLELTPHNADSLFDKEFIQHAVVTYSAYRLRLHSDELRFAPLSTDWMRSNLSSDQYLNHGGIIAEDATLTGSTEQLQKIVAEHLSEPAFFEGEAILGREESVFAAQLNSTYALAGLVQAALAHADYPLALEWSTALTKLAPAEPGAHQFLAKSLLAANDPSAAHAEILATNDLCRKMDPPRNPPLSCSEDWVSDQHFALGISDFIARKYSSAAQEMRLAATHVPGSSGNERMWEALALLAGKKEQEARETLVKCETESSSGTGKLCLFLEGKLDISHLLAENPGAVTSGEAQTIIGSWYLNSGDAAKARDWFQQALAKRNDTSYDSYECLVASARLKQLAAK